MSPRARFHKRSIVAALLAAVLAGSADMPASAATDDVRTVSVPAPSTWGEARVEAPRDGYVEGVRMADADCSAAAAEAAAETGGQVLSVSSREEGGRTVCVVTVLVPGGEGERPRKRTITVPQ